LLLPKEIVSPLLSRGNLFNEVAPELHLAGESCLRKLPMDSILFSIGSGKKKEKKRKIDKNKNKIFEQKGASLTIAPQFFPPNNGTRKIIEAFIII
jgi:hypothetical protein